MNKLILFIHGLSGSKSSFGKFEELIKEDNELIDYDVSFYEYPTIKKLNPKTWFSLPKIQSLSAGLKSTIETTYNNYDEIILVCHSMGGLIAKKYLLEEVDKIKSFSNKVSKVILYATPNIGSDLSFRLLSFNPQIRQLNRDSDFIEFLNKELKNNDILKYIDFYYIVGSQDFVVDKTSGTSFWDNHEEIEDKGHFINGVAKPKNKEDKTFLLLKKYVKDKKQLPNLNIDFLKRKVDVSIADANNRYILNKEGFENAHIDVEISKYFDFVNNKDTFLDELEKKFFNIIYPENPQYLDDFDSKIPTVEDAKSSFVSYFTEDEWTEKGDIDESDIKLKKISDKNKISEVQHKIDNLRVCSTEKVNKNFSRLKRSIEFWLDEVDKKIFLHGCQNPRGGYDEIFTQDNYLLLSPIRDNFYKLLKYFDSKEAKLFLNPMLLISGEALIGKTHIMCHMIKKYVDKEILAILILGHTISKFSDIREMILKKLDLSHLSFDLFLKEFQLLGEINNCRSILAIDAINEAGDNNDWHSQLAGLLEEIKQYPNIAIILSVRDTTRNITISENSEKYLTNINHRGLDGVEFEALEKMCDIFQIQMPSIPVLHKLNYNPGLLYLFFESLQKLEIDHIDSNIINPSYIFENIIKSVNIKLSKELDFDIDGEYVNHAITLIVEKFVSKQANKLRYKDVLKILKPHNFKFELHHLISEGIFSTYKDSDDKKYIFFTYEKLLNYFISKFIVESYIKIEHGKPTKETVDFIDGILKDSEHAWHNRMIIEPLSTLIPEKHGIELVEICSKHKENYLIQDSFLNSFIWRKKETFSENTKIYLNELISKSDTYYFDSLNILLKLSVIPDHPYNAYKLHEHLMSMNMPQRDASWLKFLIYSSDYPIVYKLIDWSWFQSNKYILNEESRKLYGITLMWMLASNSRYIRDRSTKALVSLFTDKIDVYLDLMKMSESVDDPYIQERMYAVAYGIILRSNIDNNSESLAKYIFDIQFINNKPYPHILLRDYAKGVIEAVNKEINLHIDLKLIYPPYNTCFDNSEINIKDLDQYKDEEGFSQIWWSLMYNNGGGISDFGNYILNTHLDDWSGKKFDDDEIDRSKLLEKFISSLDGIQKELWEKRKQFYGIDLKSLVNINIDSFEDEIETKPLEINKEKEKQSFEESLSIKQLEFFQKELKPYLDENDRLIDEKEVFDLAFAQRWVFKRIIELGYNTKLHGNIDKNLGHSDRNSHNIERIGKKYQWIGYHELLARVSDNYKLNNRYKENKDKIYKGPWEPTIRDIDPTTILYEKTDSNINYLTLNYKFKENKDNLSEWLNRTDDISNMENIIKIKIESQPHILLNGTFSFNEKPSSKRNEWKVPRKQIYYMIKSYIVKKEDLTKIVEWGKTQNFFGRWMPKEHELYQLFLREFPNSKAFEDFNISYYGRDGWTSKKKNIPASITLTSDCYLNEATYDLSIKETLQVSLPSKNLYDILDLKYHKQLDGIYNSNDIKELIFDPSINFGGKSCLVAKSDILKLLDKKGYSLFWTLVGEKNIINRPNDFNEKWLVVSGLAYYKENNFIECQNYTRQ